MKKLALNHIQAIDDIDVKGQRVLLRVDLNVPVIDGKITDATRIRKIIPTIRSLTERGARVVILSHFGRPNGEIQSHLSLKRITDTLRAKLSGIRVHFSENCIGKTARDVVSCLTNGEVAVMENLRFHSGEEANEPGFVNLLGELGDIYVNEAFSCSHRPHASIDGLTKILPAYAGPHLLNEIKALRTVLENPRRPVAAVIGGAKVSTKLPLLLNLVEKVDILIVGGGMANTFLHACGISIGKSLCEPSFSPKAIDVMQKAMASGCRIALPTDAAVATKFEAGADLGNFKIENIPDDRMILDIGLSTREKLSDMIQGCRTLLWNGPLGAFEIEPFDAGTTAVACKAAQYTLKGTLVTVAGGGDTIAALNVAGVTGKFTYVSTAGGAFLEWLEGRELPGITALIRTPEPQLTRSA